MDLPEPPYAREWTPEEREEFYKMRKQTMTPAIQVARECAAIVEIVRLQSMIGVPDRLTTSECCTEIMRAIRRKWPEAFIEPPAPKLRKVEEHER